MTMIQIEKKNFYHIPVLSVVQADKKDKALPTIVYYHGFNGEKESSLTLAYKIAENGFRVILPDSYLHGERRSDISQTEIDLAFWEIVMKNITELDEIKTYLEENNLLENGKIGIGGTSMGGITTYGALKQYDWVKAAAILMGTPKMVEYAGVLIDRFNETNKEKIPTTEKDEVIEHIKEFDLSLHPEQLQNRPILIWHGDKDQIVPISHSETFYEMMKEQYDYEENVKFVLEKGRSHHISKLSMEETAAWFNQHLKN